MFTSGTMTQGAQATSSERSIIAAMVELACADTSDWDSTIRHILRVEANTLPVERVSFWGARDHGKCLVCEMAYHRTAGVIERGSTLAAEDHADYFAAIGRSPLAVEDVRTDPRVQSLRGYLDAHGVSAMLAFPVWVNGRVAAVLCHEHVGPPRHWSEADEHFAATVAQTTAAALEARAEREARKIAMRAGYLDQVSRTLSETLEVDGVARRAMALIVPQLADASEVYLVEHGAIRRAAFEYGRSEAAAAMSEIGPARTGLFFPERVIARRTSILVPDMTEEAFAEAQLHGVASERIAASRDLGLRSFMAVPLFVGEPVVGVATFASTARRYGLEDLGLAEELVRRLAAALENARLHERAQAALRARNDFIELAGHELRTPLTALQLTAQDLVRRAQSAPPADIERIAASIVKQAKRLDRLTSRMLEATRATSDLPFVRAPVDLAVLARETAESLEPRMQHAGCTVEVRSEAPVVGEWDATQLEQVLTNLLDNAAKFGAGQPVEIAVGREGDEALLSVSDHGPGIPPDRLRIIFDPFERAVPAKHYGGLGLGLFISRAIVERHGGTLTVENRPSDGTTFTVRLPLVPPPPLER
jgi:signal transduction histidine kinase